MLSESFSDQFCCRARNFELLRVCPCFPSSGFAVPEEWCDPAVVSHLARPGNLSAEGLYALAGLSCQSRPSNIYVLEKRWTALSWWLRFLVSPRMQNLRHCTKSSHNYLKMTWQWRFSRPLMWEVNKVELADLFNLYQTCHIFRADQTFSDEKIL